MTEAQQRLLGFGGIGLLAVYIVRRRSTATVVAPPPQATTGSVAPYVPQEPLPLPPGESVYDPNSQALLTTPTGFPPPQNASPAAPAYAVNVTYPQPVTATKPKPKKPSKRKPTPKRHASRAKAKHKVGG